MHEGLLAIGTFARAAALSVGTLRHYHDEELLVPAYIDPSSGYRYYSAAQLFDAEVVRRLRDLDMPIERVRTVLAARDDRVTAAAIAEHEREMVSRLREAERIVAELQSLFTRPIGLLAERVEVRALPAQDVLARTTLVSDEELPSWIGQTYASLEAVARSSGLEFTGPAGAIYPGEERGELWTVTAFLPIAGDARSPERITLPGGRFAVGMHEGSYETIGDTYRALGAWLAAQHGPASYDIREYYLAGPGDVADPMHYRTEIAWPLSDGAGTDAGGL